MMKTTTSSALLLLIVVAAAAAGRAQTLEQILERIAGHQDSAQQARARVVYTQQVHAKLIRANGKLAREEKRTYSVTPNEKTFKRELVKFEGWYERGGKMIAYDKPGFNYKGIDIDGELIDDLIDEWTGEEGSKDGLDKDQFPLRRERQQSFQFAQTGPTRLSYQPKTGKNQDKEPWRGEVEFDPADQHPVSVTSTFTFKMPAAVKILFGTNIRQLGFAVRYAKAIDDLWFPVSYGTEFYFRVLFGYARTLTLNMTNSDFRRASAESTIQFHEISQAGHEAAPQPKLP